MQLYGLTMYDMSEECCQMFFIGIFSSFEKAEQIAEKMLKEVSGFKDYACKYKIDEKKVIGGGEKPEKVHMIWGWDEDEFSEPIHIIESDLYINSHEADAQMQMLQGKYKRQEWCVDRYVIDDIHWKEGFIKV